MLVRDETIRGPRRFYFKQILRKMFLEDWVMKLVALVITIALWLGVTGLSTPATRRFTVPLNLIVSNNTEITNSPIQEVDIVVSGDKRKIEQINRADLAASIDLTEVAPGDRVLSLTPDNVSVIRPLGIKLDEIQPSRIAVRLEAVEEKEVAVTAETTGEPASGFEIYSETVVPSRVRVRGPASFIKTLDSVPADRVDVSGAKVDIIARQVPISVSNPKAAVLNTVVDVSIRIGEKRTEKRLTLTTAGGRKVSAVLFGPKSLVDHVRADDIKAEMIRNENGDDEARVTLPEALQDKVDVRAKLLSQ
ncbi:MAG TPA: CdaR family protein [Pyrinomonadaceae bacterium]|nr:CdaR family protein [Pyrinomonadaceae bacterium]